MWQLSIRSKIILTLLLTGLACLAAGAIIGYRAGEKALTRSVEDQLTAQREIKRRRIESYVENELRFTVAIGGLPETAAATKAFIAAYREMRVETQANPPAALADTAALETWYNKDLLPRLDKVAGSHTPLEGLMPAEPVARRLQADYIARPAVSGFDVHHQGRSHLSGFVGHGKSAPGPGLCTGHPELG